MLLVLQTPYTITFTINKSSFMRRLIWHLPSRGVLQTQNLIT